MRLTNVLATIPILLAFIPLRISTFCEELLTKPMPHARGDVDSVGGHYSCLRISLQFSAARGVRGSGRAQVRVEAKGAK